MGECSGKLGQEKKGPKTKPKKQRGGLRENGKGRDMEPKAGRKAGKKYAKRVKEGEIDGWR